MKRLTQYVCILLACAFLVMPASAEPRGMDASNYFAYTSAYLNALSSTSFQVCFDVTAVGGMDEIGASLIKVQKSSDGTNWETVHTRTKEDYSGMIGEDTADHNYYFTYYGTTGYQYRAYIEFYAKKGNGEAYYDTYTETFP